MLPTLTLRQLNTAGQTQQGLVDDVSTRSLLTVRVGEGAGKLSTGIANAFVGYEAGKTHQQGSYATFIGYQAGEQNLNASYGTFVGAFAGRQNQRGNENVFVGYRTGERNISGSDCVAVGAYAMRDNASGNYSVAIGYSAGERCLDGSFNTMVGAEAGQDNRSGNFNTMAGYRSGRSAFLGNYNTYFGAYAGYSNNLGNENCFIGYRSGEALEKGNLNIAIGAYSMAKATMGHSNISIGPYSAFFNRGSGNILVGWNAGSSNYTGGLNVIVGVEAGTSNQGSRNVLIGYNSATFWTGDCNVLIGSEVSQTGSGFNSIIIGYKTAGTVYREGTRNIFIGAGADAIRSNVSDAISIGTYNVQTTSESLSVGKNIQSAGINSVSLGFSIETNAENSVLVGKDLIITSAVYFKDPLNSSLAGVVLRDANEKFGIYQIHYNNNVLGTVSNPYETAEYGYLTSNTYNTTTNPNRNPVSPDTYDLANYMPYFATIYGCNIFFTHTSCNLLSYGPIHSMVSSNIQVFRNFQSTPVDFASYVTVYPTNEVITNEIALGKDTFKVSVSYSNILTHPLILNIDTFGKSNHIYPVHVAKRHVIPTIDFISSSNVHTVPASLSFYTQHPLSSISNAIDFTSDGLTMSSMVQYIVYDTPTFGVLHTNSTSNLQELTYQPLFSSVFVQKDSFTVLPSIYLYDSSSNLFGITSNIKYNIELPYASEYILSKDSIHLQTGSDKIYLNSNLLVWTRDGSYIDSSASYVSIQGFDNRYRLVYRDQNYTCNEALSVPSFSNVSITCNVTVHSDHFVVHPENVALSNLTLYIGNTYRFIQQDACNVGFPLRFSSCNDGTHNGGQEYTCNVTSSGILGVDSYIEVVISGETPNPLYYFALSSSNIGGALAISPEPRGPLRIPYHAFLTSNLYLQPLPATTVQDPVEPLLLAIEQSVEILSNVSIPIDSSNTASLWEDAFDTLSSTILLQTPLIFYNAPEKLASNIFIESHPAHGLLSWVGASNNLKNLVYQPLDPWAYTSDGSSFLLQRPTNIHQAKRIKWNVQTVPQSISASNYWIDYPTSNILVETSNIPKYVFVQTSNAPLYNKVTLNSTRYDIDNVFIGSDTNTILIPTVYEQGYGVSNITTNLTVRSNLQIINAIGVNRTYEVYDKTILFITSNNQSNIVTTFGASNVIFTSDDAFIPYSNLYITYDERSVIQQYVLFNSNYQVFHTWLNTSNVYDTAYHQYIYSDNSITPYGFGSSNLVSAIEINNSDTYQTFSFSNYDCKATYTVYENLTPLHRTTLYESNQTIITRNSDSNRKYMTILRNVGEVGHYHTSNIDNGDIYLQTAPGPSISQMGSIMSFAYQYSSSTTPTGQVKEVMIPKYTAVTRTTPLVIPEYRERDNAWLVMNDKYQGSLKAWDTFIRTNYVQPSQLGFTPDTLYIISTLRGYIVKNLQQQIVHSISLSDIDSCQYQATGRYETDVLTFFYGKESTGQCTQFFINTVFIRYKPLNNAYTIASQLSLWNPFTSNAFFTTIPESLYSSVRIQFTTIGQETTPLELYEYPSKTSIDNTITWNQLVSKTIYLKTNATFTQVYDTVSIELPYRLLLANTPIETGTVSVNVIDFIDFPQPTNALDPLGTLEVVDFLELPHATLLHGPLGYIFANYVDKGGSLPSSKLICVLSRPLTYGFLVNIDHKTRIVSQFTYEDILQNRLFYVSYDASCVKNDTLYIRLIFDGKQSPEYSVSLKNYLIKSGPQNIVPYRERDGGRELAWKERAILSDGVLTDLGIPASNVSLSPSSISYGYSSNLLYSSNMAVDLHTPYTNLQSGIFVKTVAYSEPVKLITNSVHLYIDQADSVSLSELLSPSIIAYSIEDEYQLYAYLDMRPKLGVIRTTPFQNGSNLSRWTYDQLLRNEVHYHHLGNVSDTVDVFTLRFATHAYDVTSTSLQVYVHVSPLPKVTMNRYDILYELNSNTAVQSVYPLSKSLEFNTSNAYLRLISASNMYLVSNGTVTSNISLSDFSKSSYGYRFINNYFSKPSGDFYEDLTMRFSISSYSNAPIHSLAQHPYYQDYFSYPWVSQLNRAESFNLYTPFDDPFQDIEYVFDVRNRSSNANFDNLESTFSLQVKPYNVLFANEDYFTQAGFQFTKNIQTYEFALEFLDENDAILISFQVNHSNISIFNPYIPEPLQVQVKTPFTFNKYGKLQVVFKDVANRGFTSIYINPDERFSNKDNQGKNLLYGYEIQPSLENLSRIRVLSYADHPFNFIPVLQKKYAIPNSNLSVYQNLFQHVNRIYVEDFEIFTKNINTDIESIEQETYNVVLGKAIQVKGKKNICLGTNFTTLGRNSIILGNDIGYSEGFVSQIYESIIIGNTSFQGSTIRGIIAIGNELMNNLVGIDEASTDAINKFIANRPVIIGNNIGPEKVDYHINIANTLLRTKIGGLRDQIYLGNESEFVAIGYTSNVHLQGPEILFVNGGIRANRVLTDILECTGGTLNIDAVSSSNLISSNVFANLVVTDVLQCRSGTLTIDAVESSNLISSNVFANLVVTDVLQCRSGTLTIDAVESSNLVSSNVYAQKIVTDNLEYRSGIVNLQLINSSNIYASNIIVDKITTTAIEYPRGDIEFFGVIASNIVTENITTSNLIVDNSFYINPNAVGNVVMEGLRATLYERIHKVFLITTETNLLSWTVDGVHYVDEGDTEIFVNGMKLSYYNNNRYHFKIADTHYLNDFSQTKFDILLSDPVYPNDVVDIHIAPKLVGLTGNVYDYFAITSNVLNLKTVNEFYSTNATFSNIRILGSAIVGGYSQKHPYQVESIHKVFLNQIVTRTLNLSTAGYFEASPEDIHLYINGTKLAYLDATDHDYKISSNFSPQDQKTYFTITLDSDVIAGDIVDVTLFPKAPRDQFGYFYQNFEIKTAWNDDKVALTTYSNVGIGTFSPKSSFHVHGNARIDGVLVVPSIQGQVYGPWNLQSNLPGSLMTLHQQNTDTQYPIARFLANSKDVLTVHANGIGIGTTQAKTSIHTTSNVLIGNHPLVHTYPSALTTVFSNSKITNWSVDPTQRVEYEWLIGSQITPSIHWSAYVTPDSTYIIENKVLQGKYLHISNTGTVITSNHEVINTLQSSNLKGKYISASNLTLSSGITINKDETSSHIFQASVASVASNVFVINTKGWIGIGTTNPRLPFDIVHPSAIQLPFGSFAERPASRLGLLRYNTSSGEFEGCYGNGWGALGGVKSLDTLTRIEISNSNELGFYTSNVNQLTINSQGNVGIGSSLPNYKLQIQGNTRVYGDLQVNGSLVFSNIQVLTDEIFINQDRPFLRNRLQIQPLIHHFIAPLNQYILHQETLEGLWDISPENVDLFVNGTKWIYINSVDNDFTVTYAHVGDNTQIYISLTTPVNYGDVLDLTIWPKYISNESVLQPGYVYQNIFTYWERDTSSNIYYTKGNIGIGTTQPSYTLDVNGHVRAPSITILDSVITSNVIASHATITNAIEVGHYQLKTDTFTVDRNRSDNKPYVSIYDSSLPLFHIDTQGNVGIGTSIPKHRLHLANSSLLIEDDQPSLQLSQPGLSRQWNLKVHQSQNAFGIYGNNTNLKLVLQDDGNVGIGTSMPLKKLHAQGDVYVACNLEVSQKVKCSNVEISSLQVLSNASIGTLNVSAYGNLPVSKMYTSSRYPALIIGSTGSIGIGTDVAISSVHIATSDALIIPRGTTQERPNSTFTGQIRYNTSLQQFEGFGANNTWGSLGGVKSTDNKTYISAENYPGASDCNLRFFTNDVSRVIIDARGNVGIGTVYTSHTLRVQGDAYITGTIIAPYMNITSAIFYNEDSPALRNRLQIHPTQLITIIQELQVQLFNITISGVWMIHPQKVQIYINGIKLVYINELNKDYTVTFSHVNENTVVLITLDNPLGQGDVVDISIWPSYYNENALNQSGIVVQNFNYSIWTSNINNGDIHYRGGNVGIGTSTAPQKLTVQGNAIIRGELSLYRSKYSTGGIFGTETSPINGGGVTFDLNLHDNAIVELSSYTITLEIFFSNIAQNIGKTVSIILLERSSTNRILIIDNNVKFANARPSYTTANGVDRLTVTIIKPTMLLGKYESNIAAF